MKEEIGNVENQSRMFNTELRVSTKRKGQDREDGESVKSIWKITYKAEERHSLCWKEPVDGDQDEKEETAVYTTSYTKEMLLEASREETEVIKE